MPARHHSARLEQLQCKLDYCHAKMLPTVGSGQWLRISGSLKGLFLTAFQYKLHFRKPPCTLYKLKTLKESMCVCYHCVFRSHMPTVNILVILEGNAGYSRWGGGIA
jgi:hypothetical protein